MPRYVIKADVTISLEMSIEAESADDAKAQFDDEIAINAVLLNKPEDKWEVYDDAIMDVQDFKIEPE